MTLALGSELKVYGKVTRSYYCAAFKSIAVMLCYSSSGCSTQPEGLTPLKDSMQS